MKRNKTSFILFYCGRVGGGVLAGLDLPHKRDKDGEDGTHHGEAEHCVCKLGHHTLREETIQLEEEDCVVCTSAEHAVNQEKGAT